MIKKITIALTAMATVLALSGCGSIDHRDDFRVNYDNYVGYNGNNLTTLFLVDNEGYSYKGIPYICDSMRDWDRTAPNGEFSFIEPDTCEFDFNGLDGDHGFIDDEVVRIVDYRDSGKGGIDYDCASFGASSTYTDGSFDYDQDDVCSFYL
jgi:uncharacterized protein YceK